MATHLSILNLEYSFINEPSGIPLYLSNIGLWNEYLSDQGTYKVMDNFAPIHQMATTINSHHPSGNNFIEVSKPQLNNQLISLSLHGSASYINSARALLLQAYSQVHYKSIAIAKDQFLAINHKFTSHLLDICRQYRVEMIINNHSVDGAASGYYIHIFGDQDGITMAEPSMRIVISSVLDRELLECVEVDLSMIPLIGGIDLFNFNQIAKQTDSNVYIPDLLPNLFNSNVLQSTANLKMWITSKTVPQLLLTKFIVNQLILHQASLPIITKEIDICKSKLDAIVLYNQSEVLNIMFKHGVFIQMPSLGELNQYKLVVQGSNLECINEAVNEINLLTSTYYTLTLSNTGKVNEAYLFRLIQLKKTCTLTANKHGVEINGQSHELKQILNQLSTSSSVTNSGTASLRLELDITQRDFISGKKNGKLIKILNQLGQLPIIKFKPFNEYNFFIDIEIREGTELAVLLQAIDLIELELPSELQFNIPEVFHKSIIGNGGSIIQSIMKKYNVFIKFSSSNESVSDGYSFKRYNNVLIRCPRKNSKNINLVKYEIDQLVYQCWNNGAGTGSLMSSNSTIYHTVKFQLLKSHYLLLVNNNKLKQITSLESAFNSFINFPTSIENFANKNDLTVEIKGSELKSKQCFKQLSTILPKNYEFKITFMPGKFEENFSTLNQSEFFNRIVIPFKILLGIEMIVNEVPIVNGNSGDYHQIILSYFNEEHLEAGIRDLTIFLREKGFMILEKKPLEFDPLIEYVSAEPSLPVKQNALGAITNQIVNSGVTNGYSKKGSPKKSHSPRRSPRKESPRKHVPPQRLLYGGLLQASPMNMVLEGKAGLGVNAMDHVPILHS
ncbi:uncharacterized protein CANTADRAFT_52757 [Suhomyces tanzawaensis NRRL Y-17324]|uniref:K Homology domain-containing protein n=1 Tax=Suhomyces tanzawaensis NRRL Y-17324 TaxID=984487 RepID=A0A1E4SGF4_9ASCO|nr:uncharacterized protein CANTADRAFT_52757 [Suhomyces tanzawaensis NRRL Y-17324]ODV78599.1 hypothetical protein CANTADRAFT_52757 [Suhomyces tanzawaensis NRRL Y-17324]